VTTVVVAGVIPVACTPPVLTTFADPDPAGYDPRTGCLKAINEVTTHHNALLQDTLRELRARHRHRISALVYADFFGPVIDMVTSPAKFGEHTVLACHERPSRHACITNGHETWRASCGVAETEGASACVHACVEVCRV
jgi:hypothetical protein